MVSGIPLLLLIGLSIILIVLLTAQFKIHPFLALVIACFFLGLTTRMPLAVLLKSIQEGFGSLMAYIGLIVVFGSVIGVYLERSGGALEIAKRLLKMVGEKRLTPGLSSVGALVSIPVFCDSGFILLSGLADKLGALSKDKKATLSLALGTGLYTTHTLVPPTPGPIAAAGNIEATQYLGTIIITGFLISIPVLMITWKFSKILGDKIQVMEDLPKQDSDISPSETTLSRALVPLLFPIIFIAGGTILQFVGVEKEWIQFLCAPITAIFIGAVLAIGLLGEAKSSGDWLVEAIKISGPILIITGAGGAFGGVLKATPLKEFIGTWMQAGYSDIIILLVIFLIAAVLKTAQGSSTSAMVITSSLLAPIIPGLEWDQPLQYALAVLAIGGGAMTVSHFNDSYFWVVSQFSGISSKDCIRSFSILTGIQGITVLMMTVIAWMLFVN